MNQHASDGPPRSAGDRDQVDLTATGQSDAEPFSETDAIDRSTGPSGGQGREASRVASDRARSPSHDSLDDSADVPHDSGPIHIGSPFAVDPTEPRPSKPIEQIYDVGPIRYMAMGAVAASIMVMGFALVAAWWFPLGGSLIAALGCLLSILGMYSAFRKTSAALLAGHLSLFVLCYSQSVG